MNLGLFNFNNYYNRIIKRYDTLREYVLRGEASIVGEVANVNFNPNDGISTEQVCNIPEGGGTPDYALLYDNTGEIISRWFVIEAVRLLTGQYRLSLYRDVIADWYEAVTNAPMFIEKASLDMDNPLIFNSENMTYNQIKTSEMRIADSTGSAWIVGYVPEDLAETPIDAPTASVPVNIEVSADLSEYSYDAYNVDNKYSAGYADYQTKFYIIDTEDPITYYQYACDQYGNVTVPQSEWGSGMPVNTLYPSAIGSGFFGKGMRQKSVRIPQAVIDNCNLEGAYNESYPYTGVANPVGSLSEDIIAQEGVLIYNRGNGTYWRVHVNRDVGDWQLKTIGPSEVVFQNNIASLTESGLFDGYRGNSFAYEWREVRVWITYEQEYFDKYTTSIPSTRQHLLDAPYDMFAIPYHKVGMGFDGSYGDWSNPDACRRIAQALIKSLKGTESATELYDIQLLPYCPWPEISSQFIDLSGGEEGTDYTRIVDGDDTTVGIVLWLSQSSFTRKISAYDFYTPPKTPLEKKVASECDKYRIVSPTYNGEFEFSAVKNSGLSGFNIFCTYKPYSPFIKVAPVFGGLYGQEFQDGRGCICQGDFSLPQVSDAWTSYQITNKNYLNAFNRQIEHMEINNAYQLGMDIANAVGGVTSAAGTGAAVGHMAGGPIGAAVGGVGAGIVSAGAGVADVIIGSKLRAEALDYTKDQFGYKLGNIQALPYTLNNIGAQTIISKLFPFIEYYTCTEIEKEALRNKIKYNGMTVMAIGSINDYLHAEKTYIKGKLIRLEDIEEEFHFVNMIANELNQGVFI